jgi:hypothetical protein
MPPQRGPPRDPDTSDVVHQIYVKVVDSAIDSDTKSKGITLQLLTFIHQHLAEFKQMGVAMKVNKIRSIDLKNERLIDAMRKRRITSLPAVTTLYGEYIGLKAIIDLYDRNLREHAAMASRGVAAVQGIVSEEADLFRQFYGDEMTFEKAENDTEDAQIGDNGMDLATAYREHMARREQFARPAATRGGRGGAAGQPRAAPPRAAPPRATVAQPRAAAAAAAVAPPRGGNVAPPLETDADDRDFNDMLERMSRDIDENTRTQAFSAGGGDADFDENTSDPRDDLMVSAFYANQTSSDAL